MKTDPKLMLLACLVLALVSCTATGWNRAVPTSVAKQGTVAILSYRVLETPESWDTELSPLDKPGNAVDYKDPEAIQAQVIKLHRDNVRLIASDPTIDLWEEMQEAKQ
jgi:hypothetical protein